MKPSNNRIGLEDDFKTILTKLSEGNIGALNVLINLIKEEPAIDPDSGISPLGTILSLDYIGIYGSHIWVLFKDRCGQSLIKLVALFRAHQLGFIDGDTIILASQDRQEPVELDVDALLARIQKELPAFGQPAAEGSQT